MWDPCTIDLTQRFDLTFTVFFGWNSYCCGADGMAFVMQTSGNGVVGLDSGEHGYDNNNVGVNSLAVVMDTYTNPGLCTAILPTKAWVSKTLIR